MRLRRLAVAKKFGPLTQNFAGKTIILIDDSIVRGKHCLLSNKLKADRFDNFLFVTGTTIGQLIRLLKDAGKIKTILCIKYIYL